MLSLLATDAQPPKTAPMQDQGSWPTQVGLAVATSSRSQERSQETLRHPTRTRPVSRELPVDPHRDHHWGFPCCVLPPMRTCRRHSPARFKGACSLVYLLCQAAFPVKKLGRLRNCFFEVCSAITHTTACTHTGSPSDPRHRKLRIARYCCLQG